MEVMETKRDFKKKKTFETLFILVAVKYECKSWITNMFVLILSYKQNQHPNIHVI